MKGVGRGEEEGGREGSLLAAVSWTFHSTAPGRDSSPLSMPSRCE